MPGASCSAPEPGSASPGWSMRCDHWIPVPGEGGHMDIGPRTPRDFEVFPHIEKLEGRISGEQILCGRGLVNVYRAVAKADGKPSPFTTPAEITGAALAKTDPVAEEALATVRHLPRPHRRRPGAGVHEPRRRVLHRRHRAEDRAGAEGRQFPRRLRGQGAAQRADAHRCRSMSSPIRWRRFWALPPMPATRRCSASRRRGGAGGRDLSSRTWVLQDRLPLSRRKLRAATKFRHRQAVPGR